MIPTYIAEKRYSYHLLTQPVSWVSDYRQDDPTSAFEFQIRQQYVSAYDALKKGQFATALDAFQQLQNLILTIVHPSLPPTSYRNGNFVAPMDPGLIDVFASKAASVLQAQSIPGYAFPTTVVADVAGFPASVAEKLAPFRAAGLNVSAAQLQVQGSISQAYTAAAANDWQEATKALTAALRAIPDTQPGMRAAVMQDLAVATEKSGGDVKSAMAMQLSSADLFGRAKLYESQVETLTTLAGMQERAGDAAGSAKTLDAATAVQSQQRLFPVTVIPATKTTLSTGISGSIRSPVTFGPATGTDTRAAAAPAFAATLALAANPTPRLMSASFLATLEPERTFTLVGATNAASLPLTGNVVANLRTFLQMITDATDLSLVLGAVSGVDTGQIVAYLPSMYSFVIPMAIGDCLLGLGNLEDAASTYSSLLIYPYINKAYEIPKLWNKLASVYLAMGDRDYRNAADDATQFAPAKADYEHLIKTDDTLDTTSPLWADPRFAGIKTRVLAFITAGFPPTTADNPEILSKIVEARLHLQQIKSGLDFFGLAVNYLPPFSWEYLQNTAKYFAQQAAQMEQRYIQYTVAGEDETLQRQQLDQQAAVAGQTVVLEQRGLDEANAAVSAANAALNYASVQQTNAQKARAEFAQNRGALAEYDELEAWANAAAVDQGSEVSLTISGYTYYNTSGERRSLVIQDLESRREKISQDMEASSLQRNVDAATAYTAEAQAQVAEAQTQVAIANQRIALAQLQQRDTEENRDFLDMKEFSARLWFELAGNAKRVMQRYTDMATAVALLAQRGIQCRDRAQSERHPRRLYTFGDRQPNGRRFSVTRPGLFHLRLRHHYKDQKGASQAHRQPGRQLPLRLQSAPDDWTMHVPDRTRDVRSANVRHVSLQDTQCGVGIHWRDPGKRGRHPAEHRRIAFPPGRRHSGHPIVSGGCDAALVIRDPAGRAGVPGQSQ
jgi:hypothetical protein